MKLEINKACDLNSNSVLPPQCRRSSKAPGGLASSSIYGRSQSAASQMRSQQLQMSQQSFSQGISSQHGLFAQFSQNSQEEPLTNEKFGTQDRDNSVKRVSTLPPPSSYTREENLVLSRNSGNLIRKVSDPEQKFVMENFTSRGRDLASRRAEEAALRRYQAVYWLHYLVGPLGIPDQPSEKEFISCLRNGILLCNMINKIQPGSVQKVVEINAPSHSLPWDCQPLPAYQYFENIRNFLAAAEELKLPVFEASVFERENLKEGSSSKVVDCILALKAYHEWKQLTGGNGPFKPPRSPLVVHSASRNHAQTTGTGTASNSSCRQLDMSIDSNQSTPSSDEMRSLEEKIVKALAERMVDSKENMDNNLFASYHSGRMDSVQFFSKILSNCLDEQIQTMYPEMKSSMLLDHIRDQSNSPVSSMNMTFAASPNQENDKSCRACIGKSTCNHWNLIEQQERELCNVKQLLCSAKKEFESLQCQFEIDLKQLGDQVLEMSDAASGYHKVVKENRNLYNMVQDLKGNIRVFCRIRPTFNTAVPSAVDFIGKDGSLVVSDPLKPQRDGQKLFQFNQVFGPTSTQDEVFRDTQPLIRSVMDGYNVCIFAYGQTGSGKTHTMCGPPGGSARESGISYLALTDLFDLSRQREDIIKYEIQVQMVEIYNEQVRDLLAEDSASTKLEIRSCATENSLTLPDATLRSVKSTTDVINLMKLGEVNRASGSTAINARSSRSHSILTVHVRGEDVSGSMLCSCLHLVDLAGSERVDKSEVSGEGLKEAQYINKSLACLGDVISALAQKNSHIPYRNSKLTLLLQNSLGGNAKTLMFAHVSPEADSFNETISTLKFAQRVSTVELGAAHANKESAEVLELQAQIASLKKALACKETTRTPLGKPKQTIDKTPPRTRRLSIENGTTMPLYRSVNADEKRGPKTPVVKPRSRRLSLEGPGAVPPKSPTSTAIRSPMARIDTSVKVPRVPPKSPMIRIDTATKSLSFQVPETPEPQIKLIEDVPKVVLSERRNICSDIQTPCSTQGSCGTQGKTSQIRKSLRTIGKFIHGSEKRNQPKQTDVMTPFNSTSFLQEPKSPVSSNASALRRRSLTGMQPERSRRSSLGGVPTDSYTDANRNVRTPPPGVRASVKLTPQPNVRASGKLTTRWL